MKILGHIFGDTAVSADPGNVNAITDMPRPTTVSQLRSFFSSISFLHQYIPNMASLLEPLQKLNRKNTKWTWNTENEAAFRKAKSLVRSSPCLTLYRTEAEHKLEKAKIGYLYIIVSRFSRKWNNATRKSKGKH